MSSPAISPRRTAAAAASSAFAAPAHAAAGQRRTFVRSQRRCSLLVVVGWATAYFAAYLLILAHKMKVFQEWEESHVVDEATSGADFPYRKSSGAQLHRPPSNSNARLRPSNAISGLDVTAQAHSSTSRGTTSKNAYSFLVAGCDPDSPWRYRAYLYGVAVSMYALQSYGSTADFHVYVELMHGPQHTTLLPEEEALFASLHATIHYIPTDPQQSFYRSQLYKFLILNMTHYSHVFYMDSDVLPLANLDYLFDAIDHRVLRHNVAFLGKREPANGGSFILSPRSGALRLVHDIIARKERTVWNDTVGWGVDASSTPQFTYPTSKLGDRTSWDFFGADGDQGLLYYWMKFVEQDVSFVSTVGTVWHWGRSESDQVHIPPPVLSSESDPQLLPTFLGKVPSAENAIKAAGIDLPPSICFEKHKFCVGQRRPRRDFFHFTGSRKPWGALEIAS
jgi:hypothetical protein